MKRTSPADNSGAGKNHKLDFEGDGSRDVGSRQKTLRNEQESIHLLSRHSPRATKNSTAKDDREQSKSPILGKWMRVCMHLMQETAQVRSHHSSAHQTNEGPLLVGPCRQLGFTCLEKASAHRRLSSILKWGTTRRLGRILCRRSSPSS
jgi:hypothetical protein